VCERERERERVRVYGGVVGEMKKGGRKTNLGFGFTWVFRHNYIKSNIVELLKALSFSKKVSCIKKERK